MDNFLKKRKTSITPALRKAVWDLHIGMGVTEAVCPLCNLNRIYRNTNSGFEAAHIVPDKWMVDDKLTTLHLFPSCSGCNNDCGTLNIFDYLWCRGFHDVLRRMIWAIFGQYIRERPQEKNSQAWKVLDHLYGRERYPTEGYIVNCTGIYRLATAVQIQKVSDESTELAAQLKTNADLIERLATAKYPDECPRFT